MDQDTRTRISDRKIWARILYMLFFWIAYSVAELLLVLIAIFQAVVVLVTGAANEALLRFGSNLSTYIYQIAQFVTFNSESLAFPFGDWPDSKVVDHTWVEPGTEPMQGESPAPAGEADDDQTPERPL